MPIGGVLLAIIAVAIYFGALERILDRMHMTDRMALFWIAAVLIGGFINLTLVRQPVELMVNLGGAVIPLAWAVYLVSQADTRWEKTRPWLAALITASVIFGLTKVLPAEPTTLRFLDPLYLFAVVAAVVGYLFGRSRRTAFVAAMVGFILSDLFVFAELWMTGVAGQTWLGGAGAFDAVIIAGVLAVALAELFGESREFLVQRSRRDDEIAEGGPGDDG